MASVSGQGRCVGNKIREGEETGNVDIVSEVRRFLTALHEKPLNNFKTRNKGINLYFRDLAHMAMGRLDHHGTRKHGDWLDS